MDENILRTKRAELGLTLQQAASEFGIHFATLSRIERGQQTPSPALAVRMCRLYGIDLNTVYAGIRSELTGT